MNPVCIGLGSNLGDSMELLRDSWAELDRIPGIRTGALSRPYLTEPVDMESEHWFVNAAGVLTTSLAPDVLLRHLLATEQRFGRRRDPGLRQHQDRTLDLDLLLYGGLVMSSPRLVLPHPHMHRRLFVLAPLAELVPDMEIPGSGRSVREWLRFRQAEPGCAIIKPRTWPGEHDRSPAG
ncbi:MAG TPA: 2-amino-4-hydroxy-6-hydroxymethyldihydropteridine diphosphokinase [Desulfobulbus sp.]|nr:2-amino-4-hydroxy-6-hydroxymethyldihydropteridine diphosphokinase [Desulfobulbus sp.]